MAKNRYKFETTDKLKRPHKRMILNFDVKNVKVIKSKTIYFTTTDLNPIEEYFNKIGIKIKEAR